MSRQTTELPLSWLHHARHSVHMLIFQRLFNKLALKSNWDPKYAGAKSVVLDLPNACQAGRKAGMQRLGGSAIGPPTLEELPFADCHLQSAKLVEGKGMEGHTGKSATRITDI